MINYTKYEIAAAAPEAYSMIETFRTIGYSMGAAISSSINR